MLKFFRRIRYNLINENKTNKYLKYAIGEILLVVIGILIALQINNWNEERKDKASLKQYLSSLQDNIESDIFVLDSLIKRRELTVKYCKKEQLNFLNKTYNFYDTRYALYSYLDFYFKPNTSAYDALKNSSYLGKINGTTLNETLSSYHAKTYEIEQNEKSYNEFVESLEAQMAYEIDRSLMMAYIFMDSEELKATKTTQEEIDSFFKELHNTNAFRNIVNQASRQDNNIIRRYNEAKHIGKDVITRIEYMIND